MPGRERLTPFANTNIDEVRAAKFIIKAVEEGTWNSLPTAAQLLMRVSWIRRHTLTNSVRILVTAKDLDIYNGEIPDVESLLANVPLAPIFVKRSP